MLVLPVDGIVYYIMSDLPIGRPSSLISLCIFVFFVSFTFLFVCSTYYFKYKQTKIICFNGILWNLARRADGVCEASYGSR